MVQFGASGYIWQFIVMFFTENVTLLFLRHFCIVSVASRSDGESERVCPSELSEENFEMCTSDGIIWYIFRVHFVLIPLHIFRFQRELVLV